MYISNQILQSSVSFLKNIETKYVIILNIVNKYKFNSNGQKYNQTQI